MTVPKPTPRQVLDCPMEPNDSGADIIRGYLIALLVELWAKEEKFSGKRPFGNSGWPWDLYLPLVKAGFITGSLDEDGYLDDFDDGAGDELISGAIRALGEAR
jgi:hypothetical protein